MTERLKTSSITFLGITGKPFEVSVEVTHEKDTPVLFNFKGRKWYEKLTQEEKQDIADQINAGLA